MNLKQITGSVISFLGPYKSNKIIIDGNEIHISKCPLSLFQKIRFKDPLGSLVEETLYAHHELHGCSTLSLLAMWYFWQEEFLLALKDGCEIQNIIMHSQTTLKSIISAISNISMKPESLFVYEVDKILDKVPINIRFSSRHFSPSQTFLNLEDGMYEKSTSKIKEHCLYDFISKLDHDEDIGISNLVFECWKKQISMNNSKFNTDGLLVCPIMLPCSCSTVLDGLVLKNRLNPACYKNKTGKSKTLIIKGSITFEHVHLGFLPKVAVSVSKVPEALLVSEKEPWIKKCCQLILDLDIDILLIKGDIDPTIQSFCQAHCITVLSSIPWDTLKILCNSLQYSPCTYILDCNEESTIENLTIKEWKPTDIFTLNDQYFLIDLCSKNMGPLQTIVLCHPSEIILESKEHQLWHLLSRISSALNNNQLLPGNGQTEEWCCIYLEKLLHQQNLTDSEIRIITAMKNGYQNYYNLIFKKMTMNTYTKKFDDMSSKIAAWHSALSLVLITLQCDTVLINGIDCLTEL